MRNPATFSRGETDLKRVGKLARDQGCLIARKFATHTPIPGRSKEDRTITGEISVGTGEISVEEWNEVIMALQEQEAKSKSIQASKSLQEVESSTPSS